MSSRQHLRLVLLLVGSAGSVGWFLAGSEWKEVRVWRRVLASYTLLTAFLARVFLVYLYCYCIVWKQEVGCWIKDP